ncbi:MAG: cell division protein ZapA [Elusimicrobia bacterium]|nr:cell division protein ZapA [Elusimicrobiota bacterium]
MADSWIQDKIAIDILGRRYEFVIEGLTEIEANAFARQVEERMRDLQDKAKTVDTMRLAILTAILYAADLRRLQGQHDEFVTMLGRSLRLYRNNLEEALKNVP